HGRRGLGERGQRPRAHVGAAELLSRPAVHDRRPRRLLAEVRQVRGGAAPGGGEGAGGAVGGGRRARRELRLRQSRASRSRTSEASSRPSSSASRASPVTLAWSVVVSLTTAPTRVNSP